MEKISKDTKVILSALGIDQEKLLRHPQNNEAPRLDMYVCAVWIEVLENQGNVYVRANVVDPVRLAVDDEIYLKRGPDKATLG